MKKIIFVFSIGLLLNVKAQESISMGAGYANHIWYSLENGEVGTAAKNNWELAFQIGTMNVGVRNNRSVDMQIWKYPTVGLTDWATLDTNGMATNWPKVFNSDATWDIGALNQRIVLGKCGFFPP